MDRVKAHAAQSFRFGHRVIVGSVAALSILSGCTKPTVVKGIAVRREVVESTVTTISAGTVEAKQNAALGFGVGGRVSEVKVAVGDVVKKGQILARIDNRDLSAAVKTSAAELSRVTDLHQEKLVSDSALDEARRVADAAQVALDRSVIVAPFQGIVAELNLKVGEVVGNSIASDKPALRLIDTQNRVVRGNIDELDLQRVKEGMSSRVRIPAWGKQALTARVTRVVPFVSSTREQDRVSEIELTLTEVDPRIPVGASAEVEIIVDRKENAQVIPSRTVLGNSQSRYVFRVVDGRLKKTNLTIGVGNYELREVLSGLSEGDIVAFPLGDRDLTEDLKIKLELTPAPSTPTTQLPRVPTSTSEPSK